MCVLHEPIACFVVAPTPDLVVRSWLIKSRYLSPPAHPTPPQTSPSLTFLAPSPCVLREPMAFTVQYRAGDYSSTCRWNDSPCRWIVVHIFILSVLAAGLIFRSAGLFESLVRYSS